MGDSGGRMSVRQWLAIPPLADGPVARLRWCRRMELLGAGFALVLAVALWSDSTVRWLLLGVGLFSLSPWPGPGALLKRAEKRPETLVTDPDARRRQRPRIAAGLVALQLVLGAAIGYLFGGVGSAVAVSLITGVAAAVGVWIGFRAD